MPLIPNNLFSWFNTHSSATFETALHSNRPCRTASDSNWDNWTDFDHISIIFHILLLHLDWLRIVNEGSFTEMHIRSISIQEVVSVCISIPRLSHPWHRGFLCGTILRPAFLNYQSHWTSLLWPDAFALRSGLFIHLYTVATLKAKLIRYIPLETAAIFF